MLERYRRAARFLNDCNISTSAASASFFIVLSIFPLLALLLSLLRYLPIGPEDLLSALANVLPAPLMPMAEYLFNDLYTSNAFAVISTTALIAMWSASRGVFDILKGIGRIMGGEETRGSLHRRLIAILYTVFLVLAVLLTLALQVFSQSLLSMVAHWDVRIFELLSDVFQLRALFTAAVLALLFMTLYAVFPAQRMHLRDVVPGAVIASVGWLVFSFLFSIYVNYGGGSRFYGSVAIAILSMLWLYVCMCILFYGAVICRLSCNGQLRQDAIKKFFSGPEK